MSESRSLPLASGWVVVVPAREVAAVLALRLNANLEVAADSDRIWLRGRTLDEATAQALAGLPASERFVWGEGDRLRAPGALLAVRTVPSLPWQDLRSWLHVTFPVAAVPATLPPPAALHLVPAHEAEIANALLVETAILLDWIERAPALRLAPLRFAANDNGRALVLGTPLPPLPGRPAVARDGVVIPAGFRLHPRVSGTIVRSVLNVADSAVVWWDESGPQNIPADAFVPATRGAAFLTRSAIQS